MDDTGTGQEQSSAYTLVFVYGTLKGMQHGTLLSNGITKDKYVLYDGGFPICLKTKGFPYRQYGSVKGELYRIDQEVLSFLDNYEGHPDFFKRELVNVIPEPYTLGQNLTKAWMYFGNEARQLTSSRASVTPEDGVLCWR